MSVRNIISSALLSVFIAFPSYATESVPEVSPETSVTEDKYAGIEIKVNINTASADEIAAMLKGVGSKKAQEIIKYREEHGLFQSPDDLVKVKGIGQATVDKNLERIEL